MSTAAAAPGSDTGWVWHEAYGWHDTGNAAGYVTAVPGAQPFTHFESPESKTRFASLIAVSGLEDQLMRLRPGPATDTDLQRVHTAAHVAEMRRQSDDKRGGDMGDGTSPFAWGGFDIAALAAGGTIAAMQAVLSGQVRNAYALVRPPGHHAVAEQGMGFCMFNNVAVAIEHARAHFGVGKVAVIDWDVHHGNGTEALYARDQQTLTVSVHQDRNFPIGSGLVRDRGDGPGLGSVINIPLPPGSGNGAYMHAFEEVIEPSVRRFQPELIVVSSGFDGSAADPLSTMMVTSSTYRTYTERLVRLADELCSGRLVMSHEGGYSPVYVPFCGLATVEALSGLDSSLPDPFEADWLAWAGQDLQPHQRDAIAEARASAISGLDRLDSQH